MAEDGEGIRVFFITVEAAAERSDPDTARAVLENNSDFGMAQASRDGRGRLITEEGAFSTGPGALPHGMTHAFQWGAAIPPQCAAGGLFLLASGVSRLL